MASSSSSRPNRSPGPGNSMPYASCSAASQPAPTPSTARPPEITSSVVTALASSPGARSVTGLTSENSAADDVTTASAPSTEYASNMGEAGPPPTWFWSTWSGTEIASNPAASAASAASASRPNTAAPSSVLPYDPK